MSRLDIDDDPGFIEVTLKGKSVKLDLYRINNEICDLSKRAGDNLALLHSQIAQLIATEFKSEEIPSTAVAIKFMDYVFDQVEIVRKKLDGLPVSPSTFLESILSSSSDGNAQPS